MNTLPHDRQTERERQTEKQTERQLGRQTTEVSSRGNTSNSAAATEEDIIYSLRLRIRRVVRSTGMPQMTMMHTGRQADRQRRIVPVNKGETEREEDRQAAPLLAGPAA